MSLADTLPNITLRPGEPDSSTNAKPYSVSELSFALKRTLEDAYGYVRLRGEVSKVTRHSSGHVYLTLKDERACIDGVIWKAGVRGLMAQGSRGLEVIVTGRITTLSVRLALPDRDRNLGPPAWRLCWPSWSDSRPACWAEGC
jgi:hypothetical protein